MGSLCVATDVKRAIEISRLFICEQTHMRARARVCARLRKLFLVKT